jgi:hypothetical protein
MIIDPTPSLGNFCSSLNRFKNSFTVNTISLAQKLGFTIHPILIAV